MANSNSWDKIYADLEISKHNFDEGPFFISASDIKIACQDYKKTTEKEVRILCKQDKREDRPDVFVKNNLFILPTTNGNYYLVRGEGYIDIPEIMTDPIIYESKLQFSLLSSMVGNSEMQHLDFAYASSLIRTFMNDPSLVLTIRGRKFTPKFDFFVGNNKIDVSSVQTEVDAGYEGESQIVLIEAKNLKTKNTIIRQLYYPYRQWKIQTGKDVYTLFFEKNHKNNTYSIWQFAFDNSEDYNSIKLVKSARYKII